MQSSRTFLGSSTPTFHGPGIVGQVIVRTNGPANAEVTEKFFVRYRKSLICIKFVLLFTKLRLRQLVVLLMLQCKLRQLR